MVVQLRFTVIPALSPRVGAPCMDLDKAIRHLRNRKELVDRAIAQLEELLNRAGVDRPQRRRGRKFMDDAERLQVSLRMRSYWENRRKQSSE